MNKPFSEQHSLFCSSHTCVSAVFYKIGAIFMLSVSSQKILCLLMQRIENFSLFLIWMPLSLIVHAPETEGVHPFTPELNSSVSSNWIPLRAGEYNLHIEVYKSLWDGGKFSCCELFRLSSYWRTFWFSCNARLPSGREEECLGNSDRTPQLATPCECSQPH